jgi:signal peptide peptidase SppA
VNQPVRELKLDLKSLIPTRFRKDAVVIPVVRLQGMITAAGTPFNPGLSLANCASSLKRAFEHKAAPVVALVINSPGGSPVQSRLIHSRIRELAAKHKKRVLVFVEDVAASGGYMIALAGDEIIADETSIVGSIGVVSAGFGFQGAISKLGIERRVHTAGPNKAILDPFQPEKPEDVAHLKELQLQIHRIFIDMVIAARGTKLADDKDMFTGLFWTGERAKALGLVDQCGLIGKVLAERYGEKAVLQLVQPRRNLFGRPQHGVGVAEGFAGAIGQGLSGGIAPALLAALEERAQWQRFGL